MRPSPVVRAAAVCSMTFTRCQTIREALGPVTTQPTVKTLTAGTGASSMMPGGEHIWIFHNQLCLHCLTMNLALEDWVFWDYAGYKCHLLFLTAQPWWKHSYVKNLWMMTYALARQLSQRIWKLWTWGVLKQTRLHTDGVGSEYTHPLSAHLLPGVKYIWRGQSNNHRCPFWPTCWNVRIYEKKKTISQTSISLKCLGNIINPQENEHCIKKT